MIIPTADQIKAAGEYAISKMCIDIPNKYGASGLTEWDSKLNVCKLTEAGCNPSTSNNPLSRLGFSSTGEVVEFSKFDKVYGEFWKHWTPDHFVMKKTQASPNQLVCSRANHLLYKWCEFPKSRSDVPGVRKAGYTDVPNFKYVVRNGKETCLIGKDYCDNRGVSYKATPGQEDCYVSDAQKVGEFFASDVLVRKAQASDERLKDNITLLKKDFAGPGLDAYQYTWNEKAGYLYGLHGQDIGFIANKLPKHLVRMDDYGYLNLNMDSSAPEMEKIRAFLYLKQELLQKICGIY